MSKTCSYCGKGFGAEMPFRCKYCGGQFCLNHRLPESHECQGLEEVKERVRKGDMPMFPKKRVAKEIKPDFGMETPYYKVTRVGIWEKIKRVLRKFKFW